jgi:hypothetical protein
MEELIVIIIQFFLELFFNLLTLPFGGPFYKGEKERNHTIERCIFSGLLGLVLGWISLIIFPKAFIQNPQLRIMALFLSPVLAGFLSKAMAIHIHKKKDDVWPKRHFWYAFCLCSGYALVRFMGIQR